MKVVGIAGTAKNTGKTTAAVALINQIPDPSLLGVTSIGYDGEAIDNVTGLPKPRLHLPQGTIVVTAQNCLPAGSAVVEKLEVTGIFTPLGRLVIGRVIRAGLVVLAGPNSEGSLRQVIRSLKKYGINLLLVDGALNRLAPMSAAHGLILATGAARSISPEQLAAEAQAIETLLSLPVRESEEPVLQVPSLLVAKNIGVWPAEGGRPVYNTVEFTGVTDIKPFIMLKEKLEQLSQLPRLLFKDPIKLLLSGDTTKMAALLLGYVQKGGEVGVRCPLPLLAVTVNPFYPLYNRADGQYTGAMLDADELFFAFSTALQLPVVDVVRQGGESLAEAIWTLSKTEKGFYQNKKN